MCGINLRVRNGISSARIHAYIRVNKRLPHCHPMQLCKKVVCYCKVDLLLHFFVSRCCCLQQGNTFTAAVGCLSAIVAIQLFMGDNNASLAGTIEFHMTRVTCGRDGGGTGDLVAGGLTSALPPPPAYDQTYINIADNNSNRLRSCRLFCVTYLLLFSFWLLCFFFSVLLIYLFMAFCCALLPHLPHSHQLSC